MKSFVLTVNRVARPSLLNSPKVGAASLTIPSSLHWSLEFQVSSFNNVNNIFTEHYISAATFIPLLPHFPHACSPFAVHKPIPSSTGPVRRRFPQVSHQVETPAPSVESTLSNATTVLVSAVLPLQLSRVCKYNGAAQDHRSIGKTTQNDFRSYMGYENQGIHGEYEKEAINRSETDTV